MTKYVDLLGALLEQISSWRPNQHSNYQTAYTKDRNQSECRVEDIILSILLNSLYLFLVIWAGFK